MAQKVQAVIQWKDTEEINEVTFGVGDFDESIDDDIFYWVEDLDDLESLKDKNGVEGFFIID